MGVAKKNMGGLANKKLSYGGKKAKDYRGVAKKNMGGLANKKLSYGGKKSKNYRGS